MPLSALFYDLRYASRRVRANMGFSIIAVLSIGLAIGACSTIFSAVSAVLWQRLPVPHAQELVSVSHTGPFGQDTRAMSYPDFLDYRTHTQTLSGLAAYSVINVVIGSGEHAAFAAGILGSGNLFDVLGAQPVIGRGLVASDDGASSASAVVVISQRIWNARYASSPRVIGQSVMLNGVPFTIVGVARTELRPVVGLVVDVWAPLAMQEQLDPGAKKLADRDLTFLNVIGRLRAGATIGQARSDLSAVAATLERTYPASRGADPRRVRIDPATLLPAGARGGATFLAIFLAIVTGLTLALACINLANLLLARSTTRHRELGVRAALGATRGRVVQQLLTESMLLAACGGAFGLGLAYLASNEMVHLIPPTPTPLAVDLTPDLRVLAFTLVLSLLAGAAFGVLPAVRASDLSLTDALKDASPGSGQGRAQRNRRNRLVALQVALATALLVVAGLCLRSMQAAQAMNPGFARRDILLGSIDPRLRGYSTERGTAFYVELLRRVSSIPGVQDVTVSQVVPLGFANQATVFYVRHSAMGAADYNIVGPRYFSTLGVPLRAGREFQEDDRAGRPGVAIVNEALARRAWPNESALGQRLAITPNGPELDVVGVAADGKYRSLGEEALPYIYLPLAQNYRSEMVLHVATRGSPETYAAAVQTTVSALDPDVPLHDVKSLREHLRIGLLPTRVIATLLGALGLVILVLAVVGVYGVAAFNIAQRTHEVGVRLAVGASPSNVAWLLVHEGMRPVLAGIIIGLLLALGLARLMSSLLFATSAADAVSYLGVAGLLAAVGALSCMVPAARVVRSSIVAALRPE